MASLKQSNSHSHHPPSYHEHGDIELGGLPRTPDKIKSYNTGRTMRSVDGGYQDYHPNAPHDPDQELVCDDRLVQSPVFRQATPRKVRVFAWHLTCLYTILMFLLIAVAICVGLLIARKSHYIKGELVINGAVVENNTLWIMSSSPSSALSILTVRLPTDISQPSTTTVAPTVSPSVTDRTETFAIQPATTKIVLSISASVATLTETLIIPMSSSASPTTITMSVRTTVTVPGPVLTRTQNNPLRDSNDSEDDTTVPHPGKTVVVVTPSAAVITSVTLVTTTMPKLRTPPPVTITTVVTGT